MRPKYHQFQTSVHISTNYKDRGKTSTSSKVISILVQRKRENTCDNTHSNATMHIRIMLSNLMTKYLGNEGRQRHNESHMKQKYTMILKHI